MTWLIGYKEDNTVFEMEVEVDEVSPKDHYLYLYNIEKRGGVENEELENEEGDVVDVKPEEIARVRGFFNPTAWLYAIHNDVIILNGPDEEG